MTTADRGTSTSGGFFCVGEVGIWGEERERLRCCSCMMFGSIRESGVVVVARSSFGRSARVLTPRERQVRRGRMGGRCVGEEGILGRKREWCKKKV